MKDRLSFKGGVMTHFLVHVVSDLEAILRPEMKKYFTPLHVYLVMVLTHRPKKIAKN